MASEAAGGEFIDMTPMITAINSAINTGSEQLVALPIWTPNRTNIELTSACSHLKLVQPPW
jgi:hypothetical protein